MQTRDLFAGHEATLMPHDDVWLVGLSGDDERTVLLRTYSDLSAALDAVHEWALMLSDETEISADAEAVVELMRHALAQYALDKGATLPATMEDLKARDRLRTWFEHDTGQSNKLSIYVKDSAPPKTRHGAWTGQAQGAVCMWEWKMNPEKNDVLADIFLRIADEIAPRVGEQLLEIRDAFGRVVEGDLQGEITNVPSASFVSPR